ncbi:hypothetical protein [Pseudobutyrivibrio xylanivorans]|uniref:Uncharacterized protein n=1 Tax=Pseudobutyrivibrio xylanivorans TaxID=185007 RepID=A0A5P6VRH4_PSEXY|nr:hypothetical protein [Pseudobutyrivibrio xylanivorans]QFJ55295.1 hypothetical protein FXF36_10675 [Pseudobutyrivibrio xylanivorans]
MNVLDYSIKVGRLLRKTNEGRNFIEIQNRIEERYGEEVIYSLFTQLVNNQETKFYFAAWAMAYDTYRGILEDETFEDREMFIRTAELVNNDEDFKKLAEASIELENVFQVVSSGALSGQDMDQMLPKEWKFRMRNSISDIQLAVKRTLMGKYFDLYNAKKRGFISTDAAKKYLDMREKCRFLPFTKEAISMIHDNKELPEEEKELYEKMYLIREAINKGIYYGFRGKINEINKEEISTELSDIEGKFLQETTIAHNNIKATVSDGWLYKIYHDNEYFYYMVHSKEVRFENGLGNATIIGVLYPKDDRRIFETQFIMKKSDED